MAIDRDVQMENVKGWWNTENILAWDKHYDSSDQHVAYYVNSRQQKVINHVQKFNLPQGSRVLELGCGAGHTAAKLCELGYKVSGLDVSEKLLVCAKQRCKNVVSEDLFDFRCGNLDERLPYEDESFDVVIAVGVLQYVYDINFCLTEARRVLKKGGRILLAQRNCSGMGLAFNSFREFIRSGVYFICYEENELFPAFKSILCDSRLGIIFGRFRNTSFFNLPFMTKGITKKSYTLKKRLYSYMRLRKVLKNALFQMVSCDGAYYCISEKVNNFTLNRNVDGFFNKITKVSFLGFLCCLAKTAIVCAQKKD